jgi:carboxymethylenebutenolidase
MTAIDKRALTRREAVKIAGCSLATVLADPRLARAAAETLEEVSITTADGRSVKAALARPKRKGPAVIVIHEFWGLNDQIKAFTASLADEGYAGLAVDLIGKPPTADPQVAMANMRAVVPAEATETMKAWMAYLRKHKAANGKLATLGFCFGGGWSLNASLAAPADATVIYYGRVARAAPPGPDGAPVLYDSTQAYRPEDLAALKGPVLGHFSTTDQFIPKTMVDDFAAAATEAGKSVTIYWYDAEHGFANPTTARYDKEDAQLAWARTQAFLRENIG